MNIDEELKEMREAINIESHIALQLNTLLCKCNVCNAIGNLYIFLTIFKNSNYIMTMVVHIGFLKVPMSKLRNTTIVSSRYK